ncbi:NAD-dependent epimerase/dehydratase family protein [Chitinimonas viridis]|uniref:NAD-dependent epimerase/dehydratase family protein n=1 Tax=Chitinimonas viridis TaxID=664880 RepID=A0ABT8B5A1_9NEIS|nr:NAD-dependent epimerase/dehydratase family protein [Chitinimonas viridis]MDN3576905.1 NAD-dependent epimerase/dehydratase family protein [Chitinimonas viridis]
MSKILVTGGAGFIGSHTVENLLLQGHAVRVLDDLSTGRPNNLPDHPQLELLIGDIRNPQAVMHAMQGVDRVLHLAAQVSVQASVDAPPTSAERNLTGFINVLDAARQAGVQRFVYASSAAVYGQPITLPLSEHSAVHPASPYGLEKLVNDQYAKLYAELYGMSCLGLRYFNVFGPRQDARSPYAGVLSKFKERIEQQATLLVFGDGQQTRDFIYVGDVAEANRRALFADQTGVLNVATGQSRTLNQVIASFGQVIGKQLDVSHQPARTGDIVHSAAQNSALLAALGHIDFVTLEQGLAKLLAG